MVILGYIILIIYCLALTYVLVFCLMQFHLLFQYNRHLKEDKNEDSAQSLDLSDEEFPFVTVQLPIYNELYVVERLVDNIAGFDYPKNRFEIHILDDSDDETVEIAEAKVAEYKAKGYNIERITRKQRTGYKAGALRDGMRFAKGEFIAIFDADFLPNPDFLQSTIPFFKDEKIGVVQTRWEHINRDYSLITKLQAFQLNVHFTIEQVGRETADYLLQFNGTAGVWRRETIEDAGGWEADTLTEDLDLSYRAQLKGWKIHYLEDVGSPAELPAEMNGLKSQQFRWMKGGAETAKKMLPPVWRSDLSLVKKIHASVHLLSSSVFLSVFIIGVLSVPVLFLLEPIGVNARYFGIFLLSMLSIVGVYFVANARTTWKGEHFFRIILKFLFIFPVFLALSMGLSLHNSIAIIQGYIGRKSPFIRTPKFDIKNIADKLNKEKYMATRIPFTTIMEGLLCLYFIYAIYAGIQINNNSFILLHILLALGYGAICFYSVKHLRIK
ncbi:cellulose synthase family protein [Portibacter marinus]|uniref:cellulose synthase family protein n=1 Tax=Portibacter marinus TaxID=2898660 RepID=UPI001F24F836|nr:cellulose synthase family protein [Portibacter marinus]